MTIAYNQNLDKTSIDAIFADWDQDDRPGCALGIVQDGQLTYARGYGMANLEYNIPNTAQSVFRIGSTSKQFTTACIMLLVQQGKINLDDPLSKYYPAFPDYAKEVTIRHLVHHTSGIRDYLTLAYLKGLRGADFYSDEEMLSWLVKQKELNFEPGSEWIYSNSGYWLLGQLVEKVSGQNMAVFAKENIFEPLGMEHTHFHNNHKAIVKKRASGYAPKGKGYEISMTTLEMIGDGGVFTSIEDIKKWDDAFYESKTLDPAFWELMTTQGILNNGDTLEYAGGLFIDNYKGLPTVSHGGAFVGFRAELIRFPEQKTSIAIFANRGDADPTSMAYQVADVILKDHLAQETEKEPLKENVKETSFNYIEVSKAVLEQYTGTYQLELGADVEVSINKDTLHVLQKWNNSSYAILPSKKDLFHAEKEPQQTFTFSDLQKGKTQMLTVEAGGTYQCKRKMKLELSEKEMASFTGDYYSDELAVVYSIYQKEEHLWLQFGKNKPYQLEAINKNQLHAEGLKLRFKEAIDNRDTFILDAGRAKNMEFIKQKW